MPAAIYIRKLDSQSAPNGVPVKAGEIIYIAEATDPVGGLAPEFNACVRFNVSDRTVPEMRQYLQRWNKIIQMTVISGPDPQGFRRIAIRNELVSASGQNAWVQEDVTEAIAEWNERYPTCGLVQISLTDDVITVEGTFTTGQAEEFYEVFYAIGLSEVYACSRWYITPAGMSNIIANGGTQTGTSSQLNAILRDGLLD